VPINESYAHVRRFVRAKVSLDVSYEREDAREAAAPEEAQRAEAVDLGGGGVRLATGEDLPLGTVLLLRFRIPSADRELVMRGRIVLSFFNANDRRFFHGIAFTQIDPRDQQEIVHYVERLARDQAAAEN
jgi:c-di-GMP-binding flagellar brake protein YcgR